MSKTTKNRMGRRLLGPILILILVIIAGGILLLKKPWEKPAPEPESTVEEIAEEPEPVVLEDTQSIEGAEPEAVEIPIDFDEWHNRNKDIYAWIVMPDLQVDTPVLRSSESDEVDYYLEHTVDRASGLPGSLYTQKTVNGDDFLDKTTIIYGHNMRNGSMFGSLDELENETFRREHLGITIYTEEHVLQYTIIGALTYDDRLIPSSFEISTQEGFEALWESMKSIQLSPKWWNENFIPQENDKYLILSTCNGISTQRYTITAVLTSMDGITYVREDKIALP